MLHKYRQQIILWLYVACLCVVVRGAFFYINLHAVLELPPDSISQEEEQGFLFQVSPGDNFTQLTSKLQQQGILNHSADLRFYARIKGQGNNIQAGEYKLEQGDNALDLLKKLVDGEVNYHQLVLVEGWTIQEAFNAIQKNENIKSTLQNVEQLQAILNSELYPEGLLLPETYNFTRNTTDIELILKANDLLNQVLQEEWSARAVGLPYETPYEALIMASIIEKETGQASERAQIAGVFIRRLALNMRLQTDPTVIYGISDFNGNLTRANLRADTPYNTYTNKGLPPTPIAIVGREAIIASLHPDNSQSLYFVAKGDGSHYFSSTLEEHNAAVRQYQLNNE